MCGIAGYTSEHPEIIARMTKALMHRGPDGHATYVGNGISLGHARLAILDPSPAGAQPMWSADGTVVMVYNGEVFNFREIARARGFTCRTGSDTEVLLHLFAADREDFLRSVRGMYALAVYDTKTRDLWLARDSSGIKPLYTRIIQRDVAFASEVRALLHASDDRPDIDYEALSLYMHLQYVPRPRTLCEGIVPVEPGHLVRIGSDKRMQSSVIARDRSAWQGVSRRSLVRTLPDMMQQCVTEHLVSDQPVGIFLSGGMDSSVLLHHMAQVIREPIQTYTARFEATEAEGASRFNMDADLASRTAEHYKTNHTELVITASEYRDAFRECARALDLPNSDHVSVAQYLLAKRAKHDVDVILCGAGGDELCGGYPRYRIVSILRAFGWIPASLRRWVAASVGVAPDVSSAAPGSTLWKRLMSRPLSEVQSFAGEWYTPDAIDRYFTPFFHGESDPVRQAMEADRRTWLIDESLKLVDGTTMASGVEARVPFLDQRLIDMIVSTPGHWHVDFRRTKTLLKDAYRSILPDHLYSLPKASFYPPMAKWLRRECAPLVEEALEHPVIARLFQVEVLRRQWHEHVHRTGYHLHALMNVVQLAQWFDEVYEPRA